MEYSKIIIAGDYIQDNYSLGHASLNHYSTTHNTSKYTRHNTTQLINIDGGAGNVFNNVEAMCENTDIQTRLLRLYQYCLTLHRIEISPRNYLEFWNYPDPDNIYKTHDITDLLIEELDPNLNNILVYSDYNKGTLQTPLSKTIKVTPSVIIVDSKHRSLDLSYLNFDCPKIWRCTGKEYDFDWAQNFDWVIKTDGANTIMFGSPDATSLQRLDWRSKNIPVNFKTVDTIGAGDTFTAAIAAYYAKHNNQQVHMTSLSLACDFAIICCQEVIQEMFCSVTTHKII